MCRAVSAHSIDAEIYATNIDVQGPLDVPLYVPTSFEGVRTTFFPVQGPEQHFRFSLSFAHRLVSDVRRFDLIHIHSLYNFPTLVAAYSCRNSGVPYIIRPHGSLDPYHYRQRRLLKASYEALFERRNLAGAAAVHFTSEEEMRLAVLTGWRFKGAVVPLGVDLLNDGPDFRAIGDVLWPESQGKRIVLFLGRVDEKKGLDLLIPAFASLVQRRRDLHLLIAGPENSRYGQTVRSWVRERAIADRVTFAGMLTGAAKQAAFAVSSLFVLPSRSENFGVAVVEAMATGMPVVVSEHVNIAPEIVAAGAGVSVPLLVGELRGAMNRLLDNRDRMETTGRNARALAETEYSWDRVGEKLSNLYRRIIAEKMATGQQHPPPTAARLV